MNSPHLPRRDAHASPLPPTHYQPPQPDHIPLPAPQQSPPTSHFSEQPPQNDTPDGTDTNRARVYKSRNKRPCDFCRYKKAACHLESSPPCELCARYHKECTFRESPAKRRKPNEQYDDSAIEDMFRQAQNSRRHNEEFGAAAAAGGGVGPDRSSSFGDGVLGEMNMQPEPMLWDNSAPTPFQIPTMPLDNGMAPEFPLGQQLYGESLVFNTFNPSFTSATTMNGHSVDPRFASHQRLSSVGTSLSPQSQPSLSHANPHLPLERPGGVSSLDRQDSSHAQIVGISGESDPYLLSKYRFDEDNEATFQSVRFRKMTSGIADQTGGIPTFFTIQHNALSSTAQPQNSDDSLEKWRRELREIISDEIGSRLIKLFYAHVQPYFPLLSREDAMIHVQEPRDQHPCVLAAIYGHALPFCAWDEMLCVEVYTPPSADALFSLAWNASQSLLHTPDISVLQTLLLLVQRRPTNKHVSDTPFKWVMMTSAVSIAQTLGLNINPTHWHIPSWEIKQRKRLAWATFVQDKWLALNFGRSSHIATDDWDVPLLTEDDFPDADRESDESGAAAFNCHYFIKLCELTVIVNDMLRNLLSVKATRQLHDRLEATLEVAKPLRLRLTEWFQTLPPSLLPDALDAAGSSRASPDDLQPRHHELNGNGSLQLAYITAKIVLYRAMLQPRVTDANAAAVTALRTGALAVAREICELLNSLHARELEAFWASYTRTNFTIASSFMLLLFATAPTLADAKECLALLVAWRSLLRVKSGSCDLLNLALLRLDEVFVAGMERLIELSPSAQQACAENERSQ